MPACDFSYPKLLNSHKITALNYVKTKCCQECKWQCVQKHVAGATYVLFSKNMFLAFQGWNGIGQDGCV